MNIELARQRIDAAMASLTEAKAALAPDPVQPPIVVGPSYVTLTQANFDKSEVPLKRDTIYILPTTGVNLKMASRIFADGTGTLNPTLQLPASQSFRTMFGFMDTTNGVSLENLILDLGLSSTTDGIHLAGRDHTIRNLTIKGGNSGVLANGKFTKNIVIDGLIFPLTINAYGIYTQGDDATYSHSYWTVQNFVFPGSRNGHGIRVNAVANWLIQNFSIDQRASTQGYPALNIKWGNQIDIRDGTAFGRNQFGPLQEAGNYDFARLSGLRVNNVKMGGGVNGCIKVEAGVEAAQFNDIALSSDDEQGNVTFTYKSPRPMPGATFNRMAIKSNKAGTRLYGANPTTQFVDCTLNGNKWPA